MTSEVTGEDVAVAGRSASGPAGDASSRRPSGAQPPIRIAVDLLGGDEAPAVVVDGALRALAVDPGLQLLLVGPQGVADEVLRALDPADRDRVGVRVAEGAVAMADPPSRAAGSDTSLRVAAAAHADGEVDGVVSAARRGRS